MLPLRKGAFVFSAVQFSTGDIVSLLKHSRTGREDTPRFHYSLFLRIRNEENDYQSFSSTLPSTFVSHNCARQALLTLLATWDIVSPKIVINCFWLTLPPLYSSALF